MAAALAPMPEPPMRPFALTLSLAFLLAPPLLAAPDDAALGALLAKARAAVGGDELAASGRELLLEGTANENGLSGQLTLRFASDGRYLRTIDGELSRRDGCDGERTWNVDPSGFPTVTQLAAREHALLASATIGGLWCSPDGPLVASEAPSAPAPAVVLRAKGGLAEATLALDPATALPAALALELFSGTERWRFAKWIDVAGGGRVPGEFEIDDDGQKTTWSIAKAALVAPEPAAFALPTARPDDVRFDPAAPARIAGRRAPSGHLLVRAAVDGVDGGWFIFDTGAAGIVLAPPFAKELGLAPFGSYWIGGAGAARMEGHFFRAKTLEVGPMTLARPRFGELAMEGLSAALGQKVVGIVGYDLLLRVVASIDMAAGSVDLFDPAQYARADVTWRPLVLHGGHAHVTCTFAHDGEEERLFRLDSGAPGVSVLFHSPIVKELDLEAGSATVRVRGISGVGGETQAKQGTLSWFELGGATFDQPKVIFVEDERGALADPWSAGTIGGGFLERFDLIYDYPHQRIGFAPRAAAAVKPGAGSK